MAIDAHEEMFAMATATFEATSFQSVRQLARGNPFQHICAFHVNTVDPLVQGCSVQVTLECFDIRQLGHGVCISCSMYP